MNKVIRNKTKVDPMAAWGASYDMDYSLIPAKFTLLAGVEV